MKIDYTKEQQDSILELYYSIKQILRSMFDKDKECKCTIPCFVPMPVDDGRIRIIAYCLDCKGVVHYSAKCAYCDNPVEPYCKECQESREDEEIKDVIANHEKVKE
jgi:RecJ-like exonuclease